MKNYISQLLWLRRSIIDGVNNITRCSLKWFFSKVNHTKSCIGDFSKISNKHRSIYINRYSIIYLLINIIQKHSSGFPIIFLFYFPIHVNIYLCRITVESQ